MGNSEARPTTRAPDSSPSEDRRDNDNNNNEEAVILPTESMDGAEDFNFYPTYRHQMTPNTTRRYQTTQSTRRYRRVSEIPADKYVSEDTEEFVIIGYIPRPNQTVFVSNSDDFSEREMSSRRRRNEALNQIESFRMRTHVRFNAVEPSLLCCGDVEKRLIEEMENEAEERF